MIAYVVSSESQWYPGPQKDEGTEAKPQRYILGYGNCTILFILPCLQDPGLLGELSVL